jgi:transcriptional activator SPT8
LDTGSVQREYGGYTSQISSISFRPLRKDVSPSSSSNDMDKDMDDKAAEEEKDQEEETKNEDEEAATKEEQNNAEPMSKDPNIMLTTSIDGNCLIWDRREPTAAARRLTLPDKTPPWSLSV